MKAAVFHDVKNITTEDVPMPTIGDADILVKVHACGICGSDLHMYRLGGIYVSGLCRQSEDGSMIPGHEHAGEVVRVGKDVSGIEVGDRVGAWVLGGMAEYVPVPNAVLGENVFKIPVEVSWVEAATVEPMANSIHAAQLGKPADGKNAIIFGAGIIGLGLLQSLQVLGISLKKTIMVDVSEKRLELAKDLGADDVINAAREDVYQRCLDLVGDAPVTALPGGAVNFPNIDVVYDCVGYIQERPEPPVLQTALLVAKEYGNVVVHGAFEAPVTLEIMPLVIKHLKIRGSYGNTPEEAIKALELMRDKKVDRMKIISHQFPIDQVKEAFDIQSQVDNSVKVIVNLQ